MKRAEKKRGGEMGRLRTWRSKLERRDAEFVCAAL
jgi:hypothetical protein